MAPRARKWWRHVHAFRPEMVAPRAFGPEMVAPRSLSPEIAIYSYMYLLWYGETALSALYHKHTRPQLPQYHIIPWTTKSCLEKGRVTMVHCCITFLKDTEHAWQSRIRIKKEEKAKVVASVWGKEFIQFLAALAVLH